MLIITENDEKDKSIVFEIIETMPLKRSSRISLVRTWRRFKTKKPYISARLILDLCSYGTKYKLC